MKNQSFKNVLALLAALCLCNQISAMRRATGRTGQATVGTWIRPNAQSKFRYFAISPDRSCKTATRITPCYKTTFAPKRELSFGQLGSGLYKKARWSLMSTEGKQNELFDALENNILIRNADETLPSIIALFKTENLLNMPNATGLTPLEFTIKKSRNLSPEYQENYAEPFIKNSNQELSKVLYFALENYNIGAVKALAHTVKPSVLKEFFEIVQDKLIKEQTALEGILNTLRESNESVKSDLIKIRLDLMGKLYANISKLNKILDLKKNFKKPRDLETVFEEKEFSL